MSETTSPGPCMRGSIARVRKRDGREVPFDAGKIERAIAKAMLAAGEEDLSFAAEVASVVELSLRRTAEQTRSRSTGEHVPAIEEIQDRVERALIELGRAAVAKAYILYRERRAQVREVLQVRAERAEGAPLVHEADTQAPWSKARIAAALMEEARLPRATAEEVAARVERRVFVLGLERISSGLIRELVDVELFEMGLTGALHRQEALKVPRHDLRLWLSGQRPQAWREGRLAEPAPGLESAVSDRILRRYALEDVLPESVAELHLAGELHVEDLGRAHLPLYLALPASLLQVGEANGEQAFECLSELARAASGAGRGLVLEDAGSLLAPLLRGARASSPLGLGAWLRAVCALARAADRRIDLGGLGLRHAALTARLLEELLELEDQRWAPRLFLQEEELEAVLSEERSSAALVEELLARELVLPCFARGEAHMIGPAGLRRAREPGAIACCAAISLNLPRIARRSGAWREDAFLQALAALLPSAIAAARSLATFQREQAAHGRAGTPQSPAALAPRALACAALVPIGLHEALAVLSGGEIDPAQGARVLCFLDEAAGRFLAPGDVPLFLSPFGAGSAPLRLSASDAEQARASGLLQQALFPGLESAGRDGRQPYSSGFALRTPSGWWPGEAEAELLLALRQGCLYPLPAAEPRERGPSGQGLLSAWRRFRALRARAEGQERGLLFPLGARPGLEPASASSTTLLGAGDALARQRALGDGP